MKKLIGVAIGLVIFGGAFFYLALQNFSNYPSTFIITSARLDLLNNYYLDKKKIGDEKGACITIGHQKEAEVMLVRGSKQEKVFIYNESKLELSESFGHDLGLKLIRANDRPELRKKFKCEF